MNLATLSMPILFYNGCNWSDIGILLGCTMSAEKPTLFKR